MRRRHGYVTFVLNAVTSEPRHCAEGKRLDGLESFLKKLTIEQRSAIRAVCMDRTGHFRDVVREHLPHADVVFDKFHIIANYNTIRPSAPLSEVYALGDQLRTIWQQPISGQATIQWHCDNNDV